MRWGRLSTGLVVCALAVRGAIACVGTDAAPPSGAGPSADAAPNAADASTSDVSVTACSETDPFGPLESLGPAINTSDHEYPGRFSTDMLSFVFARRAAAGGQAQLFIARRPSIDVGFEDVKPVFETPTGQHDQEPSFTPWGDLVFHRGEQGSTQLMKAAPTASGFASASPLSAALNINGTERSAFVASDGTLYFARAPVGSGSVSNAYELFMSEANSDHSFAAAVPVPGLTRLGQSETLPTANGAGTVLYFSAVLYYDAGEGGTGDTDIAIYRSARSSRAVDFGVPRLVPGVNTSRYDTTAWVSDNDCTMVVAHRPAEAPNSIDLFVTRRQR